MNLRDLEYLVAVDDHRHFGRAAESCYVSQPTLSTQLKKLEAELGVELVERSPRQVLLTAAGERVVERARAILRDADAIRELAQAARDPEAATIRMGLFPTLGPYLLPHVVHDVHERFPKLELLLVEAKTEEVLDGLREGRLDVGVLAEPVGVSGLHAEHLFEEDFVLAVPADNPLASAGGGAGSGAGSGGRVTLDALAGERLLLLEDGHCLRDQALDVCQIAGASERRGFRATSLETLRQMVAAGVGVTLLPELAVQPPAPISDDIHLVRFADPAPCRRIGMYWRATSPHHGLLLELARRFRALPPGLVHTG